MTQLMEEKNVHLTNFERFEREANGDGATMPWLDELRKAGMARFDLVGFPSPKDEHWRHTQLAPIVRMLPGLGLDLDGVIGIRFYINYMR